MRPVVQLTDWDTCSGAKIRRTAADVEVDVQYYVYVNVEARDIYWALRLNRSILTLFGYVRQSVSAFVGPSDRPTDRPTDQSNERTNQQNDDPGSVRPSVAVVGRSSTGAKEGRGKEEEERANEQAVKAGRASLLSAARSLARSLATTTTYYLLHSGRKEGRKEGKTGARSKEGMRTASKDG